MSRLHAERSTDFRLLATAQEIDASSENVAVIVASDQPEHVGSIVSVNANALRMLGYTRRELVGQPLESILPQPISAMHQRFLKGYLETGRERVVNSTRQMFGLHKAGHVFPMLLGVRQMDEGFGGLMQAVPPTQDGFMIFLSRSLQITAACANSMAAFGISSGDLKSGRVVLDRFVPQPRDLVAKSWAEMRNAAMGDEAADAQSLGGGS